MCPDILFLYNRFFKVVLMGQRVYIFINLIGIVELLFKIIVTPSDEPVTLKG